MVGMLLLVHVFGLLDGSVRERWMPLPQIPSMWPEEQDSVDANLIAFLSLVIGVLVSPFQRCTAGGRDCVAAALAELTVPARPLDTESGDSEPLLFRVALSPVSAVLNVVAIV